jgi:hypothetical protein
LGASSTPYDGHASPLDLLHALHKGFVENRGRYISNTAVCDAALALATSASVSPTAKSPRPKWFSLPGSASRFDVPAAA